MLKEQVLKTIRSYQMITPDDKILVAVSGGTDSTSLLHLLASLRDELKITIEVAHLNHLIRGKDAEEDARYVTRLAKSLSLPVTIKSFDVPGLSKSQKLSLEDAGRKVRYEFFERTAEEISATKIALGHTADDNLETFLMRLLRGSGIRGLSGIPPVRGQIIRPLIKSWRRDLEEYCAKHKLIPRIDYTNYESRYLRNRIRLKLIPQLRVFNPNLKENLLNTIELLTIDNLYFKDRAEKVLKELTAEETEDGLRLDLPKLLRLESGINSHVIRAAIERLKGDLADISYQHVEAILSHLTDSEGWQIHLPDNIYVIGTKDTLTITGTKPQTEKEKFNYSLKVPGEIEIPEIGVKIKATCTEKMLDFKAETQNPFEAFLDLDKTGDTLTIRSRQEGDKFSPFGLKGTKKLHDIFIDEKVPISKRDKIPLILAQSKIAWVVGFRIDDEFKVTEKTRQVLKLRAEKT